MDVKNAKKSNKILGLRSTLWLQFLDQINVLNFGKAF